MKERTDIRPSPIAGQWYSSDPRSLTKSIERYMDLARLPELPGEVIAVVAPHAGHRYSGPVAGYAFAPLRGLPIETAIVVSPMHYPYYEPLLTTAHKAYQTPLGEISVDGQALDELDDYLVEIFGKKLARISRDPEHSLEIELPFLQCALAQPFSLVPIMMGDQRLPVARGLGACLARLISRGKALSGKRAILVASTDLSHFYNQKTAEKLDAEMLRRVSEFDPEGIIKVEEEGKGFACGSGALSSVLFAAKALGADRVHVLHHATSGDVTGDYDRVVGYGAAVVTRSEDK